MPRGLSHEVALLSLGSSCSLNVSGSSIISENNDVLYPSVPICTWFFALTLSDTTYQPPIKVVIIRYPNVITVPAETIITITLPSGSLSIFKRNLNILHLIFFL